LIDEMNPAIRKKNSNGGNKIISGTNGKNKHPTQLEQPLFSLLPFLLFKGLSGVFSLLGNFELSGIGDFGAV